MADLPVLSSVVMASVAMERLESEMSDSRSTLQVVTDSGWLIATLFSVRTAANLQRRDTQRHASSTAIPPPNPRQAVELARRKMRPGRARKLTVASACCSRGTSAGR